MGWSMDKNQVQKITETYAWNRQDIFVAEILKRKTNGVYVEIGSNEPTLGNNTYLLEKNYNIYTKLIESSSTLAKVKGDKLIPIDLPLVDDEIVITPQASGGFWTRPVEQSIVE